MNSIQAIKDAKTAEFISFDNRKTIKELGSSMRTSYICWCDAGNSISIHSKQVAKEICHKIITNIKDKLF